MVFNCTRYYCSKIITVAIPGTFTQYDTGHVCGGVFQGSTSTVGTSTGCVSGYVYKVRVQGASTGCVYRVHTTETESTEVRLQGACSKVGCVYRVKLRLQGASKTKPSEIVIIILTKAQYFSTFLRDFKLHILKSIPHILSKNINRFKTF